MYLKNEKIVRNDDDKQAKPRTNINTLDEWHLI